MSNPIEQAQQAVAKWETKQADLKQRAADCEQEAAQASAAAQAAIVAGKSADDKIEAATKAEMKRRALAAALEVVGGELAAAQDVVKQRQREAAMADAAQLQDTEDNFVRVAAQNLDVAFNTLVEKRETQKERVQSLRGLGAAVGDSGVATFKNVDPSLLHIYQALEYLQDMWPAAFARTGLPPTRDRMRQL